MDASTRSALQTACGSSHSKSRIRSRSNSSDNYEDAVTKLSNLQSNAETIMKARQQIEKRRVMSVPNMVRYIQRSGLRMEDVDRLSIIHVSGTKGKGSTCAFCERIAGLHGYKTGLFSSPHLVEVRERIRIHGRPISKTMFCQYFWKVYDKLKQTEVEGNAEEGGGMPPYFAFLTILSLHVFISEGVDVAVMEVGIGGMYDSTNVIRQPMVCGVTSLGLDHMAILGNTLDQIAWNKAGIFKLGHPAITVPQPSIAMEVILNRAKEVKSPLFVAAPMSREVLDMYDVHLGIAGMKQVENASLAIQLFRMWERERKGDQVVGPVNPRSLSTVEEIPQLQVTHLDEDTIRGLAMCEWPGRAQTVRSGSITYYLDGAHTQESIEVCSKWFKAAADKESKNLKGKVVRVLLFNVSGDRDPEVLLNILKDCDFDAAVFCTNLLSTVDSLNKTDQLNKTVSLKWMMERAAQSKACWDRLMASHRKKPPQVVSTGVPNGCGWSEEHVNQGLALGGRDVDVNANIKESSSTVPFRVAGTSSDLQRKQKVEVSGLSTSPSDYLPNPENNYLENNSSEVLVEIPHDMTSGSLSVLSTLPLSSLNNAGVGFNRSDACGSKKLSSTGMEMFIDDQVIENTPSNDQETDQLSEPPLSSNIFPSILEGLAWATQDRDPLVSAVQNTRDLPPIPHHLSDADQVQVLITGSLHLVGGVLGVITPDMNI